ncbi:MAG: MFS transporter, partial [Rubrivivax sp.]
MSSSATMPTPEAPRLSALQVLACGALIVTLSMGVRHGFGLWLQPITQAQGWTRETFSFALAIQNLSWGLFGIFAGMVADRFGAFRVIAGGAVLYALGMAGMALSSNSLMFALTTGVLIGAAQAGTTYAVIYGVIGRQIPAEKRSWAMGVAAAAGSFGQFLMVPVEGWLISNVGWQQALLCLGVLLLLIIPLALGLREPGFAGGQAPRRDQTIAQALREAFRYRSFQLLMAGYFVCGFQVVFIGVHMPSYLKDNGLSPQVASYALALIGLFNVVGTYAAGALGQRTCRIGAHHVEQADQC